MDERKKLFRLIRSISGGLEPSSELLTPARYSSGRRNAVDWLPSSELHGEIGGGILDLHLIDDIELLTEVTYVPVPHACDHSNVCHNNFSSECSYLLENSHFSLPQYMCTSNLEGPTIFFIQIG